MQQNVSLLEFPSHLMDKYITGRKSALGVVTLAIFVSGDGQFQSNSPERWCHRDIVLWRSNEQHVLYPPPHRPFYPNVPSQLLITALVILWGTRLGLFLLYR